MPVLAALLVIVGAVCMFDLVLTLGVIRRLREHTERLAAFGASGAGPMPAVMLAEGAVAAPFSAVTTDGETVSRDALTDRTLVGVFAPDCSACTERMPGFLDFAAALPGGRDRVIAVVVGEEQEAASYVGRLRPVARVVVEAPGSGISESLQVKGFPAVAVLAASGEVVESDVRFDRAAAPA